MENLVLVKQTISGNVIELKPTDNIFEKISYYKGGSSEVIIGFRQKDNFVNIENLCIAFFGTLNPGSLNEKKLSFSQESSINDVVFIKYPKNDKKIKIVMSNLQNVPFKPDSVGDFLLADSWDGREDLFFKVKCEIEPFLTETLSEDINLQIDFALHTI